MKNYFIVTSVLALAFAQSAEKKTVEKKAEAVISIVVDPRFKAKNTYFSNVPVDVIKDKESTNRKELVILPNVALGFGYHADYYYSSSTEILPQILKTAKTETTMLISGISPDLSKFYIDIKIKSNLLKEALSEEDSSELISRYVAKVISCDGEELRFGTESKNVRDLVQDLADQDFDQYLGCKLQLTLVAADKSFAPDPYNFVKTYGEKYRAYTGTSSVNQFNLMIGPHGNATFESSTSITGKVFEERQSRPSIFTLRALPMDPSPAREAVLKAAHGIAKELVAYADEMAMASTPESSSSSSESSAIKKAAFEDRAEEIRLNINELRSKFSELSIQDQFLSLTIVGRAYHYVDQVEARLNNK